jgi:group II intron reverse transcriptase/maturase
LKAGKDGRLGNLTTPASVQKLQTSLHAKAKEEPGFRFYALYDKIYRMDVLAHAYACCRANKGAPGIDGITFEDVEAYGAERWLGELAQQLKERTYRPGAVRRVFIPKPNGKLRPLGIARLADRVCQTAAMLVLGAIFEADMPSEQYAYRQGRNAQDAVREVVRMLRDGHISAVDADLASYFDTIPHVELLKSVARRIVDRRVLHLIKMWLDAPVEEDGGRGRKKRTTINRDTRKGIPQGSPFSPLLSNIYMRRFVLGWKQTGLEQRLGARIINYADDLVICCLGNNAPTALNAMRQMMSLMKLTVNEDKTRTCRILKEEFDFLGYTFGQRYSARNGWQYITSRPSKKSIKRMTEAIQTQTAHDREWVDAETMVQELNRKLHGWANYFNVGTVAEAYRAIDFHTANRLRRWLCKKHKVKGGGSIRFSYEHLYQRMGLIRLSKLPRSPLWAKA